MAITPAPDYPSRATDTQADFSAKVEAFLAWESDFADELNSASTTYLLGVSGTSVTSNSIGTGAKTWTTQTGLGFVVGQTLRIANSGTNYMTGDVTSYTSGTGAIVMNITSVSGSGTFASWTISLAAVGANAATDISFTPAGNIAATDVQSAIEELDTEKLSASAGSVTGTNLEDIITGGSVGSSSQIPVITYDANGRITATSTSSKITALTPQVTTSGTSWTFSSIPSTVKEINIFINDFSTNGTSNYLLQIGDSGGIATTGYDSLITELSNAAAVGVGASTAGFRLTNNITAATSFNAQLTLKLADSATNTWKLFGFGQGGSTVRFPTGTKSLTGTLDRVMLTATNGTDTGDAGSISGYYQ